MAAINFKSAPWTGRQTILNMAMRNKARLAGFLILSVLVFAAIFAPYIAPYDPKTTGVPYLSPGLDHLLGTNDMGQDIFSELIYASRASLAVGFISALISLVIGVTIGLIAGYFRGWIEECLMGITDVFLLIPGLPLMIVLSAYLSPSIWNIIIVVGLLWWCSTARVVHSRVLQIREMQFIESTRALGYSSLYIIARHVLINAKDVILAKFVLAVGSAMLSEASLSFLGLGDPLMVSWGEMIHFAFSRGGFANDMWWWYLPPGLMICLCVLSFILISAKDKKDLRISELI